MRDVLKVLNMIEQAKGNEKLDILTSQKSNEVLKEVCRLTYSPTVQFYIKKVPDGWQHNDRMNSSWDNVFVTLEKLSSRKVTGNLATKELLTTLNSVDCEMAEVVYRIVQKDLKCGVGSSTINKVWKNLIVKPPRQGARGCSEYNINKLKYKRKVVELKADGSFMSYFGNFMSRSGQPVSIPCLKDHLGCGAFEGYAFEGEIIFDENKASREDNGIVNKYVQGTASFEEEAAAKYLVWDCIQGNCYEPKGTDPTPNFERRLTLESMMDKYELWCDGNMVEPKIKLIERQEVDTLEEAYEIFRNYVRNGFEGSILKDKDAPWSAVDKPSWCVKMKNQDPADLLVVDIYEGTGKAKGSLGGLLLESSEGYIKTKCGSGFSDEQRKIYWGDKNSLVGKVVEIEYEKISVDSKTRQHAVTFPIFKRIREDKLEADSHQDMLEKKRIQ